MKLPFLFLAAAHSAAALPGPPKNVTTKPTTPHTSGNETTNASNGTAGRDKTFSLSQIPNPNYQQPDALSALVWVYAKHGQELPQQLKTAVETSPMLNSKFNPLLKASNGSTGTVPAYPAPFDSQYAVPVAMGTPPQYIYLDFDTGSSDLWVFSTDTYQREVNGHSIYRPKDSSTSKPLPGESWVVHYGDGSGADGNVYEDIVRLGKTSYRHQAIESAINVSPDIAADPFTSGIMGMAASSGNMILPDPKGTYIQNIQDQLAQPLFTANLLKGRPGNYNFGYIDDSEYTGTIAYAAIDTQVPLYQINVEGYQIGSGDYQPFVWNTIVDTGTSQILVPQPVVDDYYGAVPEAGQDAGTGMTVFPCSTDLPDFYFGIGEYRGRVPGSYINYGNFNSSHCYGGLQSSQGIPFGVLGDVLLKAQFVVFDVGSLMVGFANKKLH